MNTGGIVGTSPESVGALARAILDILASNRDEATIQIALQALRRGTKVENTNISRCMELLVLLVGLAGGIWLWLKVLGLAE